MIIIQYNNYTLKYKKVSYRQPTVQAHRVQWLLCGRKLIPEWRFELRKEGCDSTPNINTVIFNICTSLVLSLSPFPYCMLKWTWGWGWYILHTTDQLVLLQWWKDTFWNLVFASKLRLTPTLHYKQLQQTKINKKTVIEESKQCITTHGPNT